MAQKALNPQGFRAGARNSAAIDYHRRLQLHLAEEMPPEEAARWLVGLMKGVDINTISATPGVAAIGAEAVPWSVRLWAGDQYLNRLYGKMAIATLPTELPPGAFGGTPDGSVVALDARVLATTLSPVELGQVRAAQTILRKEIDRQADLAQGRSVAAELASVAPSSAHRADAYNSWPAK